MRFKKAIKAHSCLKLFIMITLVQMRKVSFLSHTHTSATYINAVFRNKEHSTFPVCHPPKYSH